ncbi:MAG TPA: DUF4097 family beta strand repeat-containing protein, partial [Candidatus Limnocylindrales bacterium]
VDQPIAAGGRLTIRLPAADVRIAPGRPGFVTVRSLDGRSVPDVVVVEPADDGVSIRLRERFGLTIGRRSRAIALDVAMPLDAKLATDLASGDIETRGLRAAQRHRTASGDLRLLDAGGSIEINTVSGDTRIELAVPADLGFRSVSGDLDLTGGRLTALRVSTTSGDVRLGSPLTGAAENAIETMSGDVRIVAVAGIRVEARTVSGDLSSDLPHRTEGSMGRRTLILGDGSVRLAFRSVSGDLRVVRAGTVDVETIDTAFADPTRALPGLPSRPSLPSLPPLPGASAIEPSASHDDSTPDAPAAPRPAAPADGDERMSVLRALERGELDVATAMERLAELDAEDPADG